MKKLILTSACVLVASAAAYSQGVVQWTGISFADFTATTNTTTSSYLSPGGSVALQGGTSGLTVGASAGSFYYELLYAASGTAVPTTKGALETWSDSGLEGESSSASVAGRAAVLNSNSAATVPFTGTESIILVGWSANLGSTWTAASTALESGNLPTTPAFFGESTVGSFTPDPAGSTIGDVPFGSPGIVSTATPLYVVATPEPTTIALGVMGGLSLLALRRKKA